MTGLAASARGICSTFRNVQFGRLPGCNPLPGSAEASVRCTPFQSCPVACRIYRFKLILKKNGLPRELNVHSLRHTAASLMIAGGTDVATVAGILGHSQPSTTLDIYTHAFDKNKKAASAELQGMLEI